MTTIRRINVSQIDGSSANNSDPNEIRPFGETGFYIDNNGEGNKLTLMMFDGVRNHQDSMVLQQGILYGSNSDAGDGSGNDTIKLIPDSSLGTDQYIVVDPTGGEPGHIHIRSGGTQDASTADLYLGGENNFVRISDTNDSVTIKTTIVGEGETNYFWTFNNSGYLTLPTGGTLGAEGMGWTGLSNGAAGTPVSLVYKTNSGQWQSVITLSGGNDVDGEGSAVIDVFNAATESGHQWTFGSDGRLVLPTDGVVSAGGSGGLTLAGLFDVKIVADYTDNDRTWTFNGTDGSVTFPDNTTQGTAWAGGRVVTVPVSSIGALGNEQGDLAFSNGYIYYCTADFETHESPITVDSTDWGNIIGTITSLPFASARVPQVGWTININFNNGPATLTITGVVDLGSGRYQIDFNSIGEINASNGNTGTLVDDLPVADIWKRIAWSGDTW